MLPVTVTILVQGKEVPADKVKDKKLSAALVQMGVDVGKKLANVTCPEHGKGPTQVRVHIGRSGNGDLRYDSCCLKLRDAVSAVMG